MKYLRLVLVLALALFSSGRPGGVLDEAFSQSPTGGEQASDQSVHQPSKAANSGGADEKESKKSDLRYLSKEEIKNYKIRPADVLAVDVYNEPDLSREVQVDRNGFINYPLIGRVEVKDLTQEETENKIRDLLAKDYLVNPLVSMRFVIEPTPAPADAAAAAALEEKAVMVSYIVLGEVKKPGTYEFNPTKGKMTILKAISIAGGFSDVANMSKIRLLRREGDRSKSSLINAKDIISGKRRDEEIQADDLIVVPESLI